MKKFIRVIAAPFLLALANGWLHGQPSISSGTVIYPLPTSYYGYKPVLLPGSIRTIPVGLWCANVAATDYTTSPSGTVITSANHMTVGDTVTPLGFLSTPMAYAVGHFYHVTAATSTQFTIDYADASTSTHVEDAATVRKTAGESCTGKVKWEILDTGTTAETYKLQSIDGTTDTGFVSHPVITSTIPVVRIQIGTTEGVTSQTGSKAAGTLAIASTVSLTLRATSVDDPTKTADMQMVVTANGGGYPGLQGKAFASPGFRTVYTGRHIPIASQVFGNVNQMVNTTIESAPGGGDAVLSFATFPQPDFYSGTVQGLYRLKLCPAVDSSTNACAHVSIWVDSSSPPAANTDKVEQTPCPTGAGPSLMGITWDNIYDIGPTQAHHSFLDIPQTYSGNLLVRYHNEGGVGSPTTLHEQVQINPPSSGTFSDQKPGFFACGIPNATSGELPVVDANASHANSWASQYIVGPYSFFGFAGPTGGSPIPSTGLLPWNTITLQNFKFVNATQGYTYTYVADGTTQNWGEASGPRPSNAIQNFNLIGNRIDSVSDGIFDDCNAQNQGMGHCTLDTFDEGNHLSNYGYPGDYLAHPQYRQAFRVTSLFDLYDGAISGSQGTLWFSDRGTRSFHQYNRVVVTDSTKQASVIGGHSENQDAYNILNEDEFYGYQGSASCTTANSTSLNCLSGWTLDPTAWQAAVVEEHNRTDYQIGNAISQPNVNKSIGVEMTHSWFSYQPYGGGYSGHEWFPENLSQNLFFAYNTIDFGSASVNAGAEQLIEDTRLNFSDAGESLAYLLQPQHYPEIWMTNNLIPLPQQSPACDYACNTLNVNAHQLTHFQTNMFGTITTPAGAFNSSTSAFNTNGWTLAPSVSDWGPIDPITDHLSGWTTPNFLTYSTFPVDTTTLVPSVSSDAVGAATTLTGDIAAYPPRYNAVDANMGPFTLRTSATTLGAYDPSGGSPVAPTVTTTAASSITTTTATAGGNVTSDGGASITARGTCYATTSNPTTPCTSDGTGTGSFASSLTGLTASTTYHIRAFATNSVGTSYGSDMTFTTAGAAGAPTVTTTAASSITATTATAGGNVTSDGGSSVTSRGVCYSTSSNPTTPCTSNGTGTGTFSASLSGLTASTTYHIRGFATNTVGTSYGSDLTFTTSAPPPPTLQLGGYIVLSGPNLSLQK